MAFLDVTSCIEPESETKEDPELSDLLMAMTMTRRAEILIVACASSTEDTFTSPQLVAAPVIPPKKQVKSSTAPLGGRSTY